jgi:P27 family predicted phage terminase small subunit
MGSRGPSPKPSAMKRLEGNPGKRKLNDREPRPPLGAPPRPTWIKGEALKEWKRVVPILEAVQVLTVADLATLTVYCQAWAELVECTKVISKEGRIVTEPVCAGGEVVGSRKRKHPICSLQRDAFARMKVAAGELGLSPASRTRIQSAGQAGDEVDPFAELMKRAGKDS